MEGKNAVETGIRLFNSARYFEAHEAWEAAWLEASGEEKTFLHGIIQIAAAFYHLQRSNFAGCRTLLAKGWKKVEPYGAAHGGFDLASLAAQLGPWRAFLDGRGIPGAPRPPLPQIHYTAGTVN
jgi:predicted metal-dependent hydrolase